MSDTDIDFNDLESVLTEKILTRLEILKDKYKNILEEEVMNTVYAYDASGLYHRTMALFNSITSEISIDDDGLLSLDLYFDEDKLIDHYSVVSGSHIYEGKAIYIPNLLESGHGGWVKSPIGTWVEINYPAMNFVQKTLEQIESDLYSDLGDIVGDVIIEKTGGKDTY